MSRLMLSILVVVLAPELFAQSPEAIVAKAQEFEAAGKAKKAVRLYCKAIRGSQSSGDMIAEQTLAEALSQFLEEGEDPRERMAWVMEELDSKRNGAFVSAHLLGLAVLLENTRRGERKFVKDISTVLKKHAKGKGRGKCAQSVADYAAGMERIEAGDVSKAEAFLHDALVGITSGGWLELASHVGTELCALRLSQKDSLGAQKAIADVAALFSATADPHLVRLWKTLVTTRLADAPDSVLAPFQKVLAAHPGRGGIPGANGESGESSGGSSKVGLAFASFSLKKALLTVEFEPRAFVIREGYDTKYRGSQPASHNVGYHRNGGVTLAFYGRGVALYRVSLVRGAGGPPGRSRPIASRAYYRLAPGESWSVTKTGVVWIR